MQLVSLKVGTWSFDRNKQSTHIKTDKQTNGQIDKMTFRQKKLDRNII